MAQQSPPKPWERAGANASSMSAGASTSIPNPHTTTATSSSGDQPPSLPPKPSALSSVVNRTAQNYSPYGAASRLGTSPYSSMATGIGGYSSPYASPYSRFGGMGNSMYGGYNSMYGGMGGMGGMYGGMQGPYGAMGPNGEDPNSLTNSFSQSTQATFQIIESIVGAFAGFSQMLESTYMATHSSFFAMVSVAEQFSTLRDTLGSILGIYTLLRYIRTLISKITGRPPPADATALTPSAFAAFTSRTSGVLPDGSPAPPRPSKKPFFVFLLAAFGLPYLMGKLIRALAKNQEEELQRRQQGLLLGPDGQPLPADQEPAGAQMLDPAKLPFCKLLYDFTPETANPQPGIDLAVKKGDLVAVLSKSDPIGNPSDWWLCRTRDKREGYLPGVYLEEIQRKPKEIGNGNGSGTNSPRLQTMTDGSRENSLKGGFANAVALKKDMAKGPIPEGTPGDISVESFQKSQFYS